MVYHTLKACVYDFRQPFALKSGLLEGAVWRILKVYWIYVISLRTVS